MTELTHEQQETLDRLALAHGRVAVGLPTYLDGTFVEMTVENGPFRRSFRVYENGIPHPTQPNYSSAVTRGFAYEGC